MFYTGFENVTNFLAVLNVCNLLQHPDKRIKTQTRRQSIFARAWKVQWRVVSPIRMRSCKGAYRPIRMNSTSFSDNLHFSVVPFVRRGSRESNFFLIDISSWLSRRQGRHYASCACAICKQYGDVTMRTVISMHDTVGSHTCLFQLFHFKNLDLLTANVSSTYVMIFLSRVLVICWCIFVKERGTNVTLLSPPSFSLLPCQVDFLSKHSEKECIALQSHRTFARSVFYDRISSCSELAT